MQYVQTAEPPTLVLSSAKPDRYSRPWVCEFQHHGRDQQSIDGGCQAFSQRLGIGPLPPIAVAIRHFHSRPSLLHIILFCTIFAFVLMCYAVPGTVIAIGVMIPFAAFDNTRDSFLRSRFGLSSGLLLSGAVTPRTTLQTLVKQRRPFIFCRARDPLPFLEE